MSSAFCCVPSLSSQRRQQKVRNFKVYMKTFHSHSWFSDVQQENYTLHIKGLLYLVIRCEVTSSDIYFFAYIGRIKQPVLSILLDTRWWWKVQKHEQAELPYFTPNPSFSLLPLRVMHNCTNLENLSLSTIKKSAVFLRNSA